MSASKERENSLTENKRRVMCNKYEKVSILLHSIVLCVAVVYLSFPWTLWLFANNETHQSNHNPILLTASDQLLSVRFHEVNCSENGYRKEKLLNAAPQRCGTIVYDHIIEEEEAIKLKEIVETSIAHFGHGHKEAPENVNIKRIKLFEFIIRGIRKAVIEESSYALIKNVSERIKRMVSSSFGIPENNLHFTPICEATRFKPITQFQEFKHVDKVRSPPLVATSIIWLSTCGQHFQGGRLHFMTNSPLIIEPKLGRFAAWTSSYECPHEVQELKSGERYALLFTFTVDPSSGHKTIEEMRNWYYTRV